MSGIGMLMCQRVRIVLLKASIPVKAKG
jgi:hypothetical protein